MTKKEFLAIAIATLIIVLAWAILDTLHARQDTEIPEEWVRAGEPIDPNFDIGGL